MPNLISHSLICKENIITLVIRHSSIMYFHTAIKYGHIWMRHISANLMGFTRGLRGCMPDIVMVRLEGLTAVSDYWSSGRLMTSEFVLCDHQPDHIKSQGFFGNFFGLLNQEIMWSSWKADNGIYIHKDNTTSQKHSVIKWIGVVTLLVSKILFLI